MKITVARFIKVKEFASVYNLASKISRYLFQFTTASVELLRGWKLLFEKVNNILS